MNRQINRVTAVLTVMLLALLANVTYIQVLHADWYRSQPGNQRVLLAEYSRERGAILVGSAPVAQSVATEDALQYLREYSDGPAFAPVTGFYSMVYGATGIESRENNVLAGNDSRFFVDRLQQLFANRQPKGGAVRLTIDQATQDIAYKKLAGRTGAVVAIDASTGAIVALASSPSFDPNDLAKHDAAAIQKTYESLDSDSNRPLLNRPLAMALPPGSTFKLITAAAALESGQFDPDSQLPGPKEFPLPLSTKKLPNWSGKACSTSGKLTLTQAVEVSCNTAFAWLGTKLGAPAIREQARKFGFESQFDVPMTAATSHFPTQLDDAQLAMSAIGQYDVTATALQMAMVVAGIANDGVVMRPYLVDQVLGPNLNTLQSATPSQFSRAVSAKTAKQLRKMMIGVVTQGTGSNAKISGLTVGGKTGTAENAPGEPAHAWFVGFATKGDRTIAVCAVLQNGGGATEVSGNRLAAPIAAAVLRTALAK